ncbi:unnamed protein product [Arabidopsis thaliana]|uniref:Transmembrane protein n=4 Tax=Arabidopsis TaxID=3701 RepID=A0A654FCH7_ARATH|nr:uncharacterized protein AT3G28193 [Arabidopsis thaliana]KAG7626884.1 hypothetical protein ISN45_At03g030010 [Arabidopsis thaliana x Arabidopsis arenosa]KAG7640720.1 hypothetical protein ISN44_As02g006780 [Arabidopsis suecica]AEE77414.1 transmembrane protein [Arabidopsis thaliana]CAA0383963.1 unnamed protein product [Arabidopsis thaliana]VYS58880.1 unnamed protein product [Arabidopsis thaliana]|eukprot:NP_001118724.1 transmembrane protein [Arabidopsis thaliana]
MCFLVASFQTVQISDLGFVAGVLFVLYPFSAVVSRFVCPFWD